jgi:uncharacterized protein YfaT (DUF1175 family)
LVSRWVSGKPLVKHYRVPEHALARRHTSADVVLLAEVDRAIARPQARSQPACCAASAMSSVMHASSGSHRSQWVTWATIGLRKAPAPEDRPGFIRIASIKATRRHQGPVPHQLHAGSFVWASATAAGSATALQLTAQQFEALVVGLPWQRLPELRTISRA